MGCCLKHAKVDIKLFFSCPILLDFSFLYQIFCPGLWLPLLLEILGNMRIVITCLPVFGAINFEVQLSFLTKVFFQHDQISRDKNLNIFRTKNFTWNEEDFSSILKRAFYWSRYKVRVHFWISKFESPF